MHDLYHEILARLNPSLALSIKELTSEKHLTIDEILDQALKATSHSLESLVRMTPTRRANILTSSEFQMEIGRAVWVMAWESAVA